MLQKKVLNLKVMATNQTSDTSASYKAEVAWIAKMLVDLGIIKYLDSDADLVKAVQQVSNELRKNDNAEIERLNAEIEKINNLLKQNQAAIAETEAAIAVWDNPDDNIYAQLL